MDANKFQHGGGFIKKQELREQGPRRLTIAAVETRQGFPGREGEPREEELCLVFEDGSVLSLRTQENLRRVIAAYSNDTDRWVGKPLECYYSPDVPNPKNPRDPGGIRVRVPSAAPSPHDRFVSDLEERPVKGNGAATPSLEDADDGPPF